jgi:c-di-GMP-binding flagellar brake protein YcgR
MKRLVTDQEVSISVGDVTVDCRVGELLGGEIALVPLDERESRMLPAASAGASLVFSHGGRLVMLRGAMYHATSRDDIRFAEKTSRLAPTASAEQRRKAARLPITLPVTVHQLDDAGEPVGEERQLITRDISIGGFAIGTGVGGLSAGAVVRFDLVLTSGAMIGGTARVVRAASEMTGLRFEQLAPLDRVKLAGFLASQQSNRVARPAMSAAAAR